MSKLFDDVEKKIMYWIIQFTKKEYGTSTYVMKANSKVDPPEEFITYSILNMEEVGLEQQRHFLSEDGTKLMCETTIPCLLMVSLNAYGDKAKQKILDLRNSLRGHIWNAYFKDSGMGYAYTSGLRDTTSFDQTEYQEACQIDIFFNSEWITTEEIGYIEDISGVGEIDDISGTGQIETDTTFDFHVTE